jgi:hypothetical protein
MNIVKATRKFEDWLGLHTTLVAADLKLKHQAMAENEFSFFRATFYRWAQTWPEISGDLQGAPRVLAVGDLHVENFGTWRDTDGRLVWGINDFDEVSFFPYTIDLVRLAASAMLAAREKHLSISARDAATAILQGYSDQMKRGGRPYVLGEEHEWLRQIAESELRNPAQFWQKIDRCASAGSEASISAREAIEHMLPEPGLKYRLAHRVAGLGSLGHMRLVGIAEWKGARIAREAKALTPSSIYWLKPGSGPGEILYSTILRRAVRCPDPYVQVRGHWIVRRLSPHCSRVELETLDKNRDELKLLEAMGRETANVHLGTPEQRREVLKDLQHRKGNWLAERAQAMAKAIGKDWQNWKQHWAKKN